jgi:hypothetical protein
MATVTYADPEVQRYVSENFVPVQLNVQEQPAAMECYNAVWTPTIIIECVEGIEHRRTEGYLDPQVFLEELSLAVFRAALDKHDFSAAKNRIGEALQKASGDPVREPEAMYWAAVADYKLSQDANELVTGWNRLLDRYPDSDWAKRAAVIR